MLIIKVTHYLIYRKYIRAQLCTTNLQYSHLGEIKKVHCVKMTTDQLSPLMESIIDCDREITILMTEYLNPPSQIDASTIVNKIQSTQSQFSWAIHYFSNNLLTEWTTKQRRAQFGEVFVNAAHMFLYIQQM